MAKTVKFPVAAPQVRRKQLKSQQFLWANARASFTAEEKDKLIDLQCGELAELRRQKKLGALPPGTPDPKPTHQPLVLYELL